METEIQMSSLLSLCKVKPPLDKYCSLVAETLASPTHIWPVFSWPLTGSISYRVTVGLRMLGGVRSISRPPFLDFYMDFPSRQNEKGNWISLPVPFPSLLVNTPALESVYQSRASLLGTEVLDQSSCTADMGLIFAKIAAHSRPFFRVKQSFKDKVVKT